MSIIAIGDIHGEIDFLNKLLENLPSFNLLVFIGDYIDRGYHSKEVILLIEELSKSKNVISLCGNHEDMFFKTLNGLNKDRNEEEFLFLWLQNGGKKTIESFTGKKFLYKDIKKTMEECWNFYNEHQNFFTGLVDFYQNENYFFVHAGVNPSVSIEKQHKETLLWTRDTFLKQKKEAFRHWPLIIHGHTPIKYDEYFFSASSHRLNINGGCGCMTGGTLRAIVLPEKQLIEVGRDHQNKIFVNKKDMKCLE